MSTRFNLMLLATIFLASVSVLFAGAIAIGADTNGKSDLTLRANGTLGSFVTVEYRGENVSVLARIPIATTP
jgi:hypothetical protein